MIIGYARVSTQNQELRLQMDALQHAGAEKIFQDILSGKSKEREGLKQTLETLTEGDTLVIWKLDRLGRSLTDLISIVNELNIKKINLKSLTESIDTSTPAGRFFFHLMGALAQMERELTRERVMAGLEAARRAGKYGGRPRKMTEERTESAKTLLSSGLNYTQTAKSLGITRATLYRALKR